MDRKKIFYALLTLYIFTTESVLHATQLKGRKLFGGYRISPKICEPTHPPHIQSDDPAICMFNYECSLRKGEVVGACMDGFLFGACCKLPATKSTESVQKLSNSEESIINVYEIDHIPDIPILLNSYGTPINSDISGPIKKNNFLSTNSPSFIVKEGYENIQKSQLNNLNNIENSFSNLLGHNQALDDLKLSSLVTQSDSNINSDNKHNGSQNSPIKTLLSPDQIFQITDPIDQFPAFFSHGLHSNNNTAAETVLLDKNGEKLNETHNPDDLFKPFSKETTESSTNTRDKESQFTNRHTQSIKSSTMQKMETTESTIAIKKFTMKTNSTMQKLKGFSKQSTNQITNEKLYSPILAVTESIPSKLKSSLVVTKTPSTLYDATTDKTLTTRTGGGLIHASSIHNVQSGNKKNDAFDREEIAINHIISILNDTNDPKITTQVTNGPSSFQWMDTNGLSKATFVKIMSSLPLTSSTNAYDLDSNHNYYHYSRGTTEPSEASKYNYASPALSNSLSTQISNDEHASSSYTSYSIRPTTNPPAPTVIVLGPLNSDYSTIATENVPTRPGLNSQKISNFNTKPTVGIINPATVTKKPGVSTTLTHNISTVISDNEQVLSVSYFSVNLKESTTSKSVNNKPISHEHNSNSNQILKRPSTMHTTLTSWSEKPSFHLKPSPSNLQWQSDVINDNIYDKVTNPSLTTIVSNSQEETTASDDVNNFPPVRHPELDSTVTHLQDKPTFVEPVEIISEDEIPTPDFVEDAELNNKVDVFVNKIVESLQSDFHNLKDVVYNPKNISTFTPGNFITKNPSSSVTTRRPITKPTIKGTRKSTTIRHYTTVKSPTVKIKPTSISTRKPILTKPTKSIKKNITLMSSTENLLNHEEITNIAKPVEITTIIPEITPNADFRSICGIRPLIKTARIVGGKSATFGEWPWQVLVREATWLGLFTKNKCGGVLITDKYVITAAHCQPGFLASLVAVFGEFDISGELESKRSITRNVRRVIVNRAYDPATFENDLALLELETSVQFDAHIVPICMPDDNTEYVNRMATVTGWGRLKYNGGVPSVLQEVKVPIMENSVCQEMFQTAGHSKMILDSFMCAGYANGQKDSCEGDSGGPLTLQRSDGRWILVGTVSHGIKCAAPYLPGVYMRTTYFKPWLQSITGV